MDIFEDGYTDMDSYPLNRSRGRSSRERDHFETASGLRAVAFCILVLECSQVLYHTVSRPDLSGPLARTLVASAAVEKFEDGTIT